MSAKSWRYSAVIQLWQASRKWRIKQCSLADEMLAQSAGVMLANNQSMS